MFSSGAFGLETDLELLSRIIKLLTYILSKAKLDATSQRWAASLADYNFTLTYRAGNLNVDADGLSRREVFPYVVKAVCNSATTSIRLVDSLSDASIVQPTETSTVSANISPKIDLHIQQRTNKDLSMVILFA